MRPTGFKKISAFSQVSRKLTCERFQQEAVWSLSKPVPPLSKEISLQLLVTFSIHTVSLTEQLLHVLH